MPRNDCPINMVEYGSKSLDDDEADMCIAELSWASNPNHSYALA
jgi:hypothetical protein